MMGARASDVRLPLCAYPYVVNPEQVWPPRTEQQSIINETNTAHDSAQTRADCTPHHAKVRAVLVTSH